MSGSTLQALEYLEQLPGTTHNRLYKQPSTALAVFRRILPHLGRWLLVICFTRAARGIKFLQRNILSWLCYTCQILFLRPTSTRGFDRAQEGNYSLGMISYTVYPAYNYSSERDRALSVLESLHIITTAQEKASIRAYRLLPTFATSLKHALTGGGNHRSFGLPCRSPNKNRVDVDFLDSLARSRWESILYYMVGSTDSGIADEGKISSGTKTLLELGRFVESKGQRTSITQLGFSFLLQEANTQVWNLLIVYLKNAPQVRRLDGNTREKGIELT